MHASSARGGQCPACTASTMSHATLRVLRIHASMVLTLRYVYACGPADRLVLYVGSTYVCMVLRTGCRPAALHGRARQSGGTPAGTCMASAVRPGSRLAGLFSLARGNAYSEGIPVQDSCFLLPFSTVRRRFLAPYVRMGHGRLGPVSGVVRAYGLRTGPMHRDQWLSLNRLLRAREESGSFSCRAHSSVVLSCCCRLL
jgi:hypothetical protein